MTQLTPTGIKFPNDEEEQTKALLSVEGIGPDSVGNIPINLNSFHKRLDDIDDRLDALENNLPSYILSSNTTSVNEGNSVTITLTTTKVPDNEQVPFTVQPLDGFDLSQDFNIVVPPSGYFNIQNNTDSISFTLKSDNITEGSESFKFTVNAGNNPYIIINVNDTSLTPTYSLSASPNPVSEGQSVVVTLTTTNISNGTAVPYTISANNISLSGDFSSTVASSGNFLVYNNSATKTFTLKEDDLTESAPESFTLTVNAGNNPFVSVSVNDTSQTPASSVQIFNSLGGFRLNSDPALMPFQYYGTHIEENLTVFIELHFTTMPPEGTTMNWSITGHNGFNTSDYRYAVTGVNWENDAPGVSSGIIKVDWITGFITYLGASIRIIIPNDNISETGESFTITFSNIPNSPNISKTFQVFDPNTTNDIPWSVVNFGFQ